MRDVSEAEGTKDEAATAEQPGSESEPLGRKTTEVADLEESLAH